MRDEFITAKECLNNFEKMGLQMTEGTFSKHKKKGYYKIYKREDKKRDTFLWHEVIEAFFAITSSKNMKEDQIRAKYYIDKKEEDEKRLLLNEIEKQLEFMHGFKDLDYKMFNIDNLYIQAQNEFKQLKKRELHGEIIDEEKKEIITLEASQTKEDHKKYFKEYIKNTNFSYLEICILSDVIREKLSEEYTGFKGSIFELDILKIISEQISYNQSPESFALDWGVDIIENKDLS